MPHSAPSLPVICMWHVGITPKNIRIVGERTQDQSLVDWGFVSVSVTNHPEIPVKSCYLTRSGSFKSLWSWTPRKSLINRNLPREGNRKKQKPLVRLGLKKLNVYIFSCHITRKKKSTKITTTELRCHLEEALTSHGKSLKALNKMRSMWNPFRMFTFMIS